MVSVVIPQARHPRGVTFGASKVKKASAFPRLALHVSPVPHTLTLSHCLLLHSPNTPKFSFAQPNSPLPTNLKSPLCIPKIISKQSSLSTHPSPHPRHLSSYPYTHQQSFILTLHRLSFPYPHPRYPSSHPYIHQKSVLTLHSLAVPSTHQTHPSCPL